MAAPPRPTPDKVLGLHFPARGRMSVWQGARLAQACFSATHCGLRAQKRTAISREGVLAAARRRQTQTWQARYSPLLRHRPVRRSCWVKLLLQLRADGEVRSITSPRASIGEVERPAATPLTLKGHRFLSKASKWWHLAIQACRHRRTITMVLPHLEHLQQRAHLPGKRATGILAATWTTRHRRLAQSVSLESSREREKRKRTAQREPAASSGAVR